MSEDRLSSFFRKLDAPLEPNREFAEELFESLAADLGFRPIGRRTAVARRIRRTLGLERLPTGSAALRFAYLVAILGLLLVAGLVLVPVGAALLRERSAGELVTESIARYEAPPPFVMTIRFQDGSVARFLSDGSGSIRIESLTGRLFGELPEGSYFIRTPAGQGTFLAGDHSWLQSNDPIPYPLAGLPLNWVPNVPVEAGAQPPQYTCPEWQREPDGTIAGRAVFHVTCGELAFWIDKESMLVLRKDDPQIRGASLVGEAIDLSLEPPASALFALVRPAGAFDANNPPASTKLVVGSPAPDWSGPLVDGGTFDTSSLRGRPAVLYFWADWCEPCVKGSLDAFAAASRARGDELTFASVSWQPSTREAMQQLITASGGGFRTVIDSDDAITTGGWGITAVPALVLLDAEGRVRIVTVGPFTDADLSRMLDALVSGAPVPTPAPPPPTPLPSPVPDPTVLASPPPSGEPASSTLQVGDPMPGFSGLLADKQGDIATSTLAGRPIALLVVAARCPTCETMLDEFESQYSRRHERINLVVILWGSTYRQLDLAMTGGGYRHAVVYRDGRLAEGLPVVWDDCACLSTRELGLRSVPALVFVDATGHIAGIHAGPMAAGELNAALDTLEGR